MRYRMTSYGMPFVLGRALQRRGSCFALYELKLRGLRSLSEFITSHRRERSIFPD